MDTKKSNFKYKNLTPFKWFVLQNFPFIEEDFDALTNWELFCKLGKEINEVIKSQNLVGEQAEKLTDAYNELETYVNNYFDNLDVQAEINVKLDKMASDGTLDKIINEKILNDVKKEIADNKTDTEDKIEQLNNKLQDKTNLDELKQKRIQGNYYTTGMFEKGTMSSIVINSDSRPQIMGMTTPSRVATYTNRDCVGQFIYASPNIPILKYENNDAIYSNNGVELPTISEEDDLKLQNTDLSDVIIDTDGGGTGSIVRYSAMIDRYENKKIYVIGGWYGVPSDGSTLYVPAKGTNLIIGMANKTWGQNIVVNLPSDNICASSTGIEVQVNNNRDTLSNDNTGIDILLSSTGNKPLPQTGLKIRCSSDKSYNDAINISGVYNIGIRESVRNANNSYFYYMTSPDGSVQAYLKGNGIISALKFEQELVTSTTHNYSKLVGYKTIRINNYDGSNIQFINVTSNDVGRIYFIQNVSGQTLNYVYTNGGGSTSKLAIETGIHLIISDGYSWAKIL